MNPNIPPLPPVEPLDADERLMARALRNLPSALPPAELDARILGASRRAIAMTPKPRSRRGWAWGLSSAAAAVLALGVMTKMHLDRRDAAFEPTAPAPTATPAIHSDAAEASDAAAVLNTEQAAAEAQASLPVTNPLPAQIVMPMSATPITQADLAKDVRKQSESREAEKSSDSRQEAARSDSSAYRAQDAQSEASSAHEKTAVAQPAAITAPQPFPASPKARAPVVSGTVNKAQSERDAQAPAADAVGGAVNAAQSAARPAPPPAPPPPPSPSDTFTPPVKSPPPSGFNTTAPLIRAPAEPSIANGIGASASDSARATESRGLTDKKVTLPSIDSDTKLPPAQWIERIRHRVDAADGRGARESLRQLLARYPQTTVPPDLAPLQQ